MNRSEIKRGGVFRLKSKDNCLVEIIKVEDSQARVSLYDENGSEPMSVYISDLREIPLSISILCSLGFEEKEGRLMGLIYEHYWQKQVNEHIVLIVDDGGILKYGTIDENAYYGVKLSTTPSLHELQHIIGSIDVAKLLMDLNSVG